MYPALVALDERRRDGLSAPICTTVSAIGNGSPDNSSASGSKGWAMRVRSRRKRRWPEAYSAAAGDRMTFVIAVTKSGEVEEMLAVGKESRMAVGVVTTLFVVGRHIGRIAAKLRYTPNRSRCFRREEDHALGAPASTLAVRRIAQGQGLTAGCADLFELALGKEPEILGVRRPERVLSVFGSGQDPGLHLVEVADKDPHLAVDVPGGVGQRLTVG